MRYCCLLLLLLLLAFPPGYTLGIQPLPTVCPSVVQPRCGGSSASAGALSSTAAAAAAVAAAAVHTPDQQQQQQQQQSATPPEQQAPILQHLRALADAEEAELLAAEADVVSSTAEQAVLDLNQIGGSSYVSSRDISFQSAAAAANRADGTTGASHELPKIFTGPVPHTPTADLSSISSISSSDSSNHPTAASSANSDASPSSLVQRNLTFLESRTLKLGLDIHRLGAVSWLSSSLIPEPWTDKNLINVYDQGRLLQQSFYGCEDGSCWAGRAWRFNPVQGGSWRNDPSLSTHLDVRHTQGTVYVEGHPRNWAKSTLLRSVHFTQKARVTADVATLTFTVQYSGNYTHPYLTHETPAVFIDRRFAVLVYYAGHKPWTGDRNLTYTFPPSKNVYMPTTEGWAAYIDPVTGWGVGVLAPHAWAGLTAYRIGTDWSTAASDCSYFAHTIRMQLRPGLKPYSYKVYVTVGRISTMRRLFAKILKFQPHLVPGATPTAEEAPRDGKLGLPVSAAGSEGAGADVIGVNPEQQQQQAPEYGAEESLLGRNFLFGSTGAAVDSPMGPQAASKQQEQHQ